MRGRGRGNYLNIMKHYKSLFACSHKPRDKPFIELVHNLQVHVRGPVVQREHDLVHIQEASVHVEKYYYIKSM